MWGPSRSQRQENTSKILSAAFVCEMHLLVGESLLGVEEYPTIKVLGTADQMVCFFKSLVYWDIIAEKCSLSKEKWNIFMIRNILHGFLFFFFTKKNALPFSFCLSQWQNKIKDVKEEKVKNVKMKENV